MIGLLDFQKTTYNLFAKVVTKKFTKADGTGESSRTVFQVPRQPLGL
ncbi:protein of unknown function [Latilactobacillus sakei]|nr:protein of unknown function [Latilactobacillus sakei]